MAKKSRKQAAKARLLAKIKRVLKKHRKNWLRRKGVVSLGYGLRQTKGQYGFEHGKKDVLAIIVNVEKKYPDDQWPHQRLKPFPKKVEGVDVDVVETPPLRPSFAKVDPLAGGAAIALKRSSGVEEGHGTFAVVLRDKKNRIRYLTCAHVAFGTSLSSGAGDRILQPPGSSDAIGKPEHCGLHGAFGGKMDAATITPNFQRPHELYQVGADIILRRLANIDELFLNGTLVHKLGAKTGFTDGRVVGIKLSAPVSDFNWGITLANLVRIRGTNGAFAQPGDSGSMAITGADDAKDDWAAIGMVIGVGGPGDDHAYAQPLAFVIRDLELKLDDWAVGP